MQRLLSRLRPLRSLHIHGSTRTHTCIPIVSLPSVVQQPSILPLTYRFPVRSFAATRLALDTLDAKHTPPFSIQEASEEATDEETEELLDRANYPDLFPDESPSSSSDLDSDSRPHSDEDDAWFVDPAYEQPTSSSILPGQISSSDFVPLWQRRAAENDGGDIVARHERENKIDMTLPSVVELLEQSRLENVQVIDVRSKCDWTDYMIVAESDRGERFLSSVADEVQRVLKHSMREHTPQLPLPTIEGRSKSSDWLLIDAGHYIVHLFTPEARRQYDLETLWEKIPEDPLLELEAQDIDAEEMEQGIDGSRQSESSVEVLMVDREDNEEGVAGGENEAKQAKRIVGGGGEAEWMG
ncbi:Oligomerization domain-containing protein [Endogone sp. FLAS-F59071]|nr:Oligomerization domain-containing protein [Endogone sp. FLAS-F59071]|eukprot:RUS16300.1 Oligomerization domain-containing protein [Endogone sp. FLAS-F59071]